MSDSPLTLNRLDLTHLWGRDAFANELMAKFKAGCTSFGLEGVTGAGKSEFCYQFARAVQEDRGPDPLRIEGGFAQTEELLIASLCVQLQDVARVAEPGFAENAERFLKGLLPNLRKIGGAMVKDVAKALGPGEMTVDALSNFLSGIDSDPDLYGQLAALNEGNRRILIAHFLQFVTDLGNPLCIIVDDYENTEPSAREFLKVLLRNKPANCLLIIAVNTEQQPQSDWRQVMAPSIEAVNGMVAAIPDLTLEDLSSWYEARIGQKPEEATLAELISQSHGGRPAYVTQILDAIKKGESTPSVPSFYSMQVARRADLSPGARKLGDLMCLIPGDVSIPLTLLSAAARAAGIDVGSALDELYGASLIMRAGKRARFVHSSYRESWISDIDQGQKDLLLDIWYIAFVEVGNASAEDATSGLLPLLASRIIGRQSGADISQLAEQLEEHGAENDSLVLLNAAWRANLKPESAQDMIEHALKEARLQLNLGRYAKVQEPLHTAELNAPEGSPLRIEADLLRMKLSLRLNCYGAVWSLSEKLATIAPSDEKVQIERELIVNTALRDLVDNPRIVESIGRLRNLIGRASDSDRASINRSLARSLAKVGEVDESMALAEEGLRLANAEGDARVIGNAYLAMGEAFRHAGQEDIALGHYRNAIDFGRATGNRDSEIWSLLGQACAQLQMNDLPQARESINEAAKLTDDPGFEHPLEAAHVGLISTLIDILEGQFAESREVLPSYRRLGIDWPVDYLDVARSSGSLPGAVPI